jgi:ferricrocin synthase
MQGPESLDIVPRGGVGEFCFGGEQVFRGYLNMPALNCEKIIQHPKFGRLFRSGDYGRILADGCLEFHGRKDDQIKIRGQRVELGEINHIMLQSPKVIDVYTLVDLGESTFQRLLTFWVPSGKSTVPWHILDDQELSEILQELFVTLVSSLPTYMVPSFLIPIPYMPMTAQGKIDKRRLVRALSSMAHEKFVQFARSVKNGSDEQNLSGTERRVSQTFCTTVSCVLEQVGRHVSFFSLGLDSVSAILFSRLLREQGFYEADVAMVLRHASVAKLSNRLACEPTARLVDDQGTRRLEECFSQEEIKDIALRFDEGRIVKILPCTPLQEAMLSSLNTRGKMSYFNHTVFEIHGDLDQLYYAWDKMTSKHEILRTCFTPTENERYSFAQVILSSHELDWTSTRVENDHLDTALEVCMNEAVRDAIEGKPQYSFTTLQSAKKTVLVLSMHHSLYDGEAFQLLLRDVEASYDGHYSLPPVPSEPFLSRVLSLNLDEADEFWNEHLQNFKPKLLSDVLLGESSTQREKSGSFVMTEFSSASLHSIVGCCKKLHISMLSLLQASWAKLLSLLLNTTDICFGNVVNGRTLPLDGIERIVAPCFNTIPLRLQLAADLSSLDVIKTAQQFNLNMLPFQFTPLRRIHKLQGSQNSRLFDTLFILQKPQESLDNHIWSVEQDVGAMDVRAQHP